MSALKKNGSRHNSEELLSPAEEYARVKALKDALGPLSGRAAIFCTDACFRRFLRARNWNVKKSEKMLREALKWRAQYKPEEIKWDEVAVESETGKTYRANFLDKMGRTVIIMRPANQNTTDQHGQIRHLVYCMENAILNLPLDQEQMVWLIDFKGWSVRKSVPISVVREVAYILQNMYPERLGLGILYGPPKIFETFWAIVKPFLDPKTFNKVRFVYPKKPESLKLLNELFDMDSLEASFGGYSTSLYDHMEYAKSMKVDDVKTAELWQLDSAPEAATAKLGTADGQLESVPDGPSPKLATEDKERNLKDGSVKETLVPLEAEVAQTV